MEKKFPILLAITMISASILAGCGTNGAEENATEENAANSGMENNSVTENSAGEEGAGDTSTEGNVVNMDEGVDTVLTNLDELKSTLEESANVEKLNEQGMSLEANWDKIEAQIEEEYPEDYKNIEESLYPLIDEAKKDEPDTTKMNELIDETIMKITEFKEKVTAS
ncbi:hypothetical protein ABFG93_06085 [Pseudalkalibacillus hwajinpoensis]|uniref:hypothetical protein n=1 Tax=Guptibacillus hwajinpoensis TaxID=208199 RepID=UPI00325BC833